MYASCKHTGSAISLSGNVYVLTIYIGDPDFSQENKVKFWNALRTAEDWLKAQAKKYGKVINFSNGFFGSEQTVIVDNIVIGSGSGKEPVDILEPILSKIGYKTTSQFYEWAVRDRGNDSCLVLIVADKEGRSYSIPYVKGCNTKYFTECCMMYTQYAGRTIWAASIAHEMLHCFGAWDLYQNYLVSEAQADAAARLYPDDIMRRISPDIGDLNIGALTAWGVGLSDSFSRDFELFGLKKGR